MDTTIEQLATILLGVVAIAGIALIVSKQSQTSGVITAATTGLSNLLNVAISPVAGAAAGSYNTSSTTPY